jgi:hypothetical protein
VSTDAPFYSDHYSTGRGDDRFSLSNVDPEDWLSPKDAIARLENANLPMPAREFLVFLASRQSLICKAEIVQRFNDGGAIHYTDMTLKNEWDSPAWTSPHADLWFDATMRLPGTLNVAVLEFRNIAFERRGVERILARFDSEDPFANLKTGTAGRPKKGVDLYMIELRRLAETNKLSDQLSEQADVLRAWLRTNHPTVQQPSSSAVRNNIRDEYRRLKSGA